MNFNHQEFETPEKKKSMKMRLILSLGAISLILISSALISLYEYGKVSSKLSTVSSNTTILRSLDRLSSQISSYHIAVLRQIGDESVTDLPEFDFDSFKQTCDSCSSALSSAGQKIDFSILSSSLEQYVEVSSKLESIMLADFVDNNLWYYESMHPSYTRLMNSLSDISSAVHRLMEEDAQVFDRGFYSSIIPGVVSAVVTVLLLLMFSFFVIRSYVNPVYKIIDSINAYNTYSKKYSCEVKGDDQMAELNEAVKGLVSDNEKLKKGNRAKPSETSDTMQMPI